MATARVQRYVAKSWQMMDEGAEKGKARPGIVMRDEGKPP